MTDTIKNGELLSIDLGDNNGAVGAQIIHGKLNLAYRPNGNTKPQVGLVINYADKTWKMVEVRKSQYVKGMSLAIFEEISA